MNQRDRERADAVRAIRWERGVLWLLDQRRLPAAEEWLQITDAAGAAEAIRSMVVRGAPAIGITAAYGLALEAERQARAPAGSHEEAISHAIAQLVAARPTAVNLAWALERMAARMRGLGPRQAATVAVEEAVRIHAEDVAANRRMGELGAELIAGPCDVLTHCNTGSLATGGYGTALGVVRSAWRQGRIRRVYAGETRPWLQGARLTAWELARDGIPFRLIADGAGAWLMSRGDVGWLIVGADRIAANGDTANKIGTLHAAVAARQYGVRVMVVAPTSTIDLSVSSGGDIPVEERDPGELCSCGGCRIAPADADAWNPVFDVTPAALIDALVTERGVVRNPDPAGIGALFPDGGGR